MADEVHLNHKMSDSIAWFELEGYPNKNPSVDLLKNPIDLKIGALASFLLQ